MLIGTELTAANKWLNLLLGEYGNNTNLFNYSLRITSYVLGIFVVISGYINLLSFFRLREIGSVFIYAIVPGGQ
jgi:hypothetical protein